MSNSSVHSVYATISLALLMGVSGVVHAQSEAAQSTGAAQTWTATDAQRELLGSPRIFGGYAISVPLGYVASPDLAASVGASMPHTQVIVWRGPTRVNGSYPIIFMGIREFPSANPGDSAATPFLSGLLRGFEKTRSNFTHSKIEEGTLAGMQASRTYWGGDMLRPADHSRVSTSGVIYAVFDPSAKVIISILGEDTEPFYAKSSKSSLDAAALTLKIK